MREWTDYRPCCRAAAAGDRSALFCPECGHPLFRCAARGCLGLVTPLGHCHSCVDVRLSLEKGAVLSAGLGECVSVPFAIRNEAAAGSLSIRSVARGVTNTPPEAVPLAWERLESGQARPFKVDVGPFQHAGLNNLRITMVVSALIGDIEESYAFCGDVAIDVQSPDAGRDVKIDLGGAHLGTGTMVVANSRPDGVRERAPALPARTDVALERAERHETAGGFRGDEASGLRVPRTVEFAFAGFPPADVPPDGPLLVRPAIRCGRNRRRRDGPEDMEPNDLCLRIYHASGALDRDASGAVSRHACEFLLSNDRLYVRSLGDRATAMNGESLPTAALRIVSDGDIFACPAGPGRQIAFTAAFRTLGGLVRQVRFEKVP